MIQRESAHLYQWCTPQNYHVPDDFPAESTPALLELPHVLSLLHVLAVLCRLLAVHVLWSAKVEPSEEVMFFS